MTFLGSGFLKYLYKGFLEHEDSGIIVAIEEGKILGFLAYSKDISRFYKYLIKKYFFQFAIYAFFAFLKKPKIMRRLFRSLTYSHKSKRKEKYVELSSLATLPLSENRGIGTKLIDDLKSRLNSNDFEYIKLDTDAVDNDRVNKFYEKNGFRLNNKYVTNEGRLMNELRFYL